MENKTNNKKSNFKLDKKRLGVVAGVFAIMLASAMIADTTLNAMALEREQLALQQAQEAAAQRQLLVAEAQNIQISNDQAREQSKATAITDAYYRAIEVSTTQEAEQAEREQAIKDAAAAEAAKKAAEEYAAYMAKLGTFDPSIYDGYTGQSTLSYWESVNSDTVGYLRIPGTNISHAVVQNNYDVNYYTPLGYNKQASYYGVLWSNPNTTSGGSSANLSDNTVIYGHNWKNISSSPQILNSSHQMFEQLASYHYTDFARSHPYIYYSTPVEEMTFVVFAVYYSGLEYPYNQTEGNNAGIVQDALSRSRHDFGVDVNGTDKILTLSTCTRAYGSSANQRFVVMARLLRPGETIEEISVTYDPYHQQPVVR